MSTADLRLQRHARSGAAIDLGLADHLVLRRKARSSRRRACPIRAACAPPRRARDRWPCRSWQRRPVLPSCADRADDGVAGLLGEPGLQAVRADIHRQQWVAVALGDLVPGETRSGRIVAVEIRDSRARDGAPAAPRSRDRRLLSLGRQAGGILEDRVFEPDRCGRARSSAGRNSPRSRPCPSAMMMQPSLADWTTTPWIRSSSRMRRFELGEHRRRPEGAPPVRQAFSLTTNVSSSVRRPDLIASNTTSIVISLAREAGGIGLSASLENRIVPVSASIMKACLALVSKSWAAAGVIGSHASAIPRNPASGTEKRSVMKQTTALFDSAPPPRQNIAPSSGNRHS